MAIHRYCAAHAVALLAVASILIGWTSPARAADGDDPSDNPSQVQMSTDRPGAGDGASVVSPGRLQTETGFSADFQEGSTNASLGHTLIRYGLASFAEARLLAAPVGLSAGGGAGADAQPLTDVTLGAKLGIEPGSDAAVAAIPYVSAATPTDEVGWSAGGTLAADIGTSQPVGMSFNFGAASVPVRDGRGLEVFGSVSGNASLSDAAGAYAELYTIVPPRDAAPRNFVDGGVTYAVLPRLQLDGWLGFEIAPDGTRSAGLGLSYLFF